MNKKKFIIDTHHFSSVSVEGSSGKQKLSWTFFRNFFKKPKFDFHKIATKTFLKSFLVFILLIVAGWGIFALANAVQSTLQVKDDVLADMQAGIDRLSAAQQAFAAKDLSAADNNLLAAGQDFAKGKLELRTGNFLLATAANILPQSRQAQHILDAAEQITRGGRELLSFYSTTQDISLSPQGLSTTDNLPGDLQSMGSSLQTATNEISTASEELLNVNPSIIPSERRAEFSALTAKLAFARVALSTVNDIFGLVSTLAVSQKNVLVLFENNNELRPGGGFIGTYGNFNLTDGKINNLTISSIYDLDGQLDQNIIPPSPLLAVNNRWYMRDSNWFADFQASAKKAADFYEQEGGQTPDMVVAVTPSLVTSLLKITGPVFIPSFGVTVTADNFVEKTQAISTMSINSPDNKPKQILADFFPVFLQKLSGLPKDQYGNILEALEQNLQGKQLLFASRDPAAENIFQSYNWAGAITPSDRDYLSIVDSNLGGTKTDLYIKKDISLVSTVAGDGSITNTLTMTLKNPLPKSDDTKNTSFIRFLVPQSSKLISNVGFGPQTFSYNFKGTFVTDPDAAAWERAAVTDDSTGTLIGQESGKTFFGNWVVLAGGESKTISLTYSLPFRLQNTDRLSLILQKQPGSVNQTFSYSVNFPGKQVQWESFKPDSQSAANISATVPLEKDYFFGLLLKNN